MHLLLIGIALGMVAGYFLTVHWEHIVRKTTNILPPEKEIDKGSHN